MLQHLFREEREGGAEEGAREEQGYECARGVVVVAAPLGVRLEDVAGERSTIFINPVANEDERERGSGPRESLDV